MQYDHSIYSREDLHHDANRIFREGEKALKNADMDKPVKVFGLFEVDAGLAAYATMGYNIVSDRLSGMVGKHSYDLTSKLLSPHASPNTTLKAAALATTGVNVVLKTGGYVMPVFNDIKVQREERVKLARRVATVLDEEVGSHSVRALRTAAKENTVLKAHLLRMGKVNSVTNWNNLIDLGVNAAPNLALDSKRTQAMFKGEHPRDFDNRMELQARRPVTHDTSAGSEMKEMGKLFMQGGTGAITDRIKKSNLHKLQKNLRPYTALDMILTLDEQMQGNPKARNFQVPGKRGEAYPLEEYLARTVIHHYAEMADLSNDFSEVREALHEELAKAVKPLADALRHGELSAMELVQLIGEEKIVQKGGRVIASPDDVADLIGAHGDQAINRSHETPHEHYARASYNREELKKALHALDKEEQRALASLFSPEVQQDAGMKKSEIKANEAANSAEHDSDRDLAELVLGTAAQGMSSLKAQGAAEKEIAEVEKASDAIARHGAKAVHGLRSSANNPNGIEHALANIAVPQIVSDKAYLGTVRSAGRELLARRDQETEDTGRPSHRERLQHERATHGFNTESFR